MGAGLKGTERCSGRSPVGEGLPFPVGPEVPPSAGGSGVKGHDPPFPLGSVILELSKEKAAERLLERQAAAFGAAVAKVEAELGAQIRYLTQVGGRGSKVRGQRSGLGGGPK